MCNSLAIVPDQQIASDTIIGIVDSTLNRTQCAGGIGTFLFAPGIAPIIIGPHLGLICRLVVLPGQLVEGIAAPLQINPIGTYYIT